MAKTIGIDLGTTNTVVAVLEGGRPCILEDDKGYKVLPSVVSLKEEGRFLVGSAAKNRILTHPDRTVFAVKRLIGRHYDAPEVETARHRMPYRMGQAPDGGVQLGVGDTVMSPQEVSAVVLRVAREIAAKALADEVDEAVVTVPAYFNHAQRAATLEAVKLSGLKCDRLLNEPTAAALAYGFRRDLEKTLLIFDLGGGTFDVSVLHLSGGVYEILSTSGDTFLGGQDFDFRLVDHLADLFKTRTGVDLREESVTLQRLVDAAERTKCELSFTDRATVFIPRIIEDQNLELAVSRETLEELVEDLVQRTTTITRAAVNDAGLKLAEIDDVILVGGQTRMPRVREVVSGLFGREPSRSVHPEEVVAVGAAVHAESLANPEAETALLIDITPFDLGIDSAGGVFSTIIERNTKIPGARTRTFTTVVDNQEKVRITVRQGESRRAEDNEFLGEFVLSGLRPAARMEPKLDVSFRIDGSGMLHVSAADRLTGERQQVVIRNYAEAALEPGGGPTGPSPSAAGEEVASPAIPGARPAHSAVDAGLLGRLLKGVRKARRAQPPPDDAATPAIELPGTPAAPPEPPAIELPEPTPAPEEYLPVEEHLPPAPEPEPAAASYSMAGGGLDEAGDVFEMPEDDLAPEPEPAGQAVAPADLPPPPMMVADEDEPLAMPADGDQPYGLPAAEPGGADGEPVRMGVGGLSPMEPSAVASEMGLPGRPPEARRSRKRKPAKLRITYRRAGEFIEEYRENLRRGEIFVKTPKPLPVGRECRFEIKVPGVDGPVVLHGVVSWSSRGQPQPEERGMRVSWRLSDDERASVEELMGRLAG